jgi:Delta7-sterol 5-desaturase
MVYAVVLLVGFFALTFLGWIVHWAFHQSWGGRFNVAHMTHHLKLYPPTDFVSDEYRDPKNDNTFWLFLIVFSPLILGVILLTVFQVIPIGIGLCILFEMSFIGAANNYLHDSFHITKSIWHRWPGFKELYRLHYNHHVRMDTNFGIFSFLWDRVFGTYRG